MQEIYKIIQISTKRTIVIEQNYKLNLKTLIELQIMYLPLFISLYIGLKREDWILSKQHNRYIYGKFSWIKPMFNKLA